MDEQAYVATVYLKSGQSFSLLVSDLKTSKQGNEIVGITFEYPKGSMLKSMYLRLNDVSAIVTSGKSE